MYSKLIQEPNLYYLLSLQHICVICQEPLGKYHNEAKGVHNQPSYLIGDLPCATLTDKGC